MWSFSCSCIQMVAGDAVILKAAYAHVWQLLQPQLESQLGCRLPHVVFLLPHNMVAEFHEQASQENKMEESPFRLSSDSLSITLTVVIDPPNFKRRKQTPLLMGGQSMSSCKKNRCNRRYWCSCFWTVYSTTVVCCSMHVSIYAFYTTFSPASQLLSFPCPF